MARQRPVAVHRVRRSVKTFTRRGGEQCKGRDASSSGASSEAVHC